MSGLPVSWMVETLFASTLLMLLVLALRGRAQALFGARIAYLLWLLPALRMVLPPLPELAVAQPVAHLPVRIDLSAISAIGVQAAARAGEAAPVPVARFDWMAALLMLWLLGALIHFGWHVVAYRRFLRRALERSVLLSRDCGISVRIGKGGQGPLAAGIVRRYILLPADFTTRYDRREQRLALAHEVAHHIRGDLIANGAALLLLSLHWFNPIAHLAYRAFRNDQELACDATVLAEAPAGERHAYGLAVVKSACARLPAAACALHPADQLKRRLKMMAQVHKSAARRRAGAAIGVAIVAGGLLLTASGGFAAETARKVERHVAAVAPMPPVPPVPPVPMAAPPAAPAAPEPPAAPVPPSPPSPPSLDEAMRAAMEAEERARAARLQAEAAAKQARQAAEAAVANMDIAGMVRSSLAAARAGLEAACAGRPGAKVVTGDDARAIGDMASACGDTKAIRADMLEALRDARMDLAREKDLAARQRNEALAVIDAEIARLNRDGALR
ncbi:hypothetical protein CLG96_06765 [Sphingomonas oleivorans]|uniref:Peptidase M56 domain-containing protein n=1 Tax=Sphingomonas oleivorans TaxID=1735121 RepID=A0A2T5FZV2_9SPHN|nr:M56 family metallopeptidase [Sphingomonas oleivorans]PTQ12243.1 hypothetical protein CLG96_06765 [Sphingomonas oleivorans]